MGSPSWQLDQCWHKKELSLVHIFFPCDLGLPMRAIFILSWKMTGLLNMNSVTWKCVQWVSQCCHRYWNSSHVFTPQVHLLFFSFEKASQALLFSESIRQEPYMFMLLMDPKTGPNKYFTLDWKAAVRVCTAKTYGGQGKETFGWISACTKIYFPK